MLERMVVGTINTGAILIFIFGVIRWWFISKGATHLPVFYWLSISSGGVNIIATGAIMWHMPEAWGMVSFQIMNVWSIIMSLKGLRAVYGKKPQ
jgi:hypothetical protein